MVALLVKIEHPNNTNTRILKRNDLFCALVAWPEAIADAKRKKLVEMIIAIVISIVSGIFILGCIGWGISRMRRRAKRTGKTAFYKLHIATPCS